MAGPTPERQHSIRAVATRVMGALTGPFHSSETPLQNNPLSGHRMDRRTALRVGLGATFGTLAAIAGTGEIKPAQAAPATTDAVKVAEHPRSVARVANPTIPARDTEDPSVPVDETGGAAAGEAAQPVDAVKPEVPNIQADAKGDEPVRAEAPPSDDVLRTNIEARMNTIPPLVFEDGYDGKASEPEARGKKFYEKMIAQGLEVDGKPAEAANFYKDHIKAPVSGLPTSDPRLSPSFSVRSPDEVTLQSEQFRLSTQEPFRVYFDVTPDQSTLRPKSIAKLVVIAFVNGSGKFEHMRADDAKLSLFAIIGREQIRLSQEEATRQIREMGANMSLEDRESRVKQIGESIRSNEFQSRIHDLAYEQALQGVQQALDSGKKLYVDPELQNMLDEYKKRKPKT